MDPYTNCMMVEVDEQEVALIVEQVGAYEAGARDCPVDQRLCFGPQVMLATRLRCPDCPHGHMCLKVGA